MGQALNSLAFSLHSAITTISTASDLELSEYSQIPGFQRTSNSAGTLSSLRSPSKMTRRKWDSVSTHKSYTTTDGRTLVKRRRVDHRHSCSVQLPPDVMVYIFDFMFPLECANLRAVSNLWHKFTIRSLNLRRLVDLDGERSESVLRENIEVVSTFCPKIELFRSNYFRITNPHVTALARGCPRIRALHLNLTEDEARSRRAVAVLAGALPELRALQLRSSVAERHLGAGALMELVRGCRSLTAFSLADDTIHPTLPVDLRALLSLPCLRVLDLKSASLPLAGALAGLNAPVRELTHLCLWGSDVSTADCAAIRRYMGRLEFLDLMCTEITNEGLADLLGLRILLTLNETPTASQGVSSNILYLSNFSAESAFGHSLETLLIGGTHITDATIRLLGGLDPACQRRHLPKLAVLGLSPPRGASFNPALLSRLRKNMRHVSVPTTKCFMTFDDLCRRAGVAQDFGK
eukprot:228105_1